MARVGRLVKCCSAIVRQTESGAERWPPGPSSRSKRTDSRVSHGGAVPNRSSTAVSVRPAMFRTSRPHQRHSEVQNGGVGAVVSTVNRSGSSAGNNFAQQIMRATRTPRREWAVGRPASAMRRATGFDCGRPVTTLAAARSSISISCCCCCSPSGQPTAGRSREALDDVASCGPRPPRSRRPGAATGPDEWCR